MARNIRKEHVEALKVLFRSRNIDRVRRSMWIKEDPSVAASNAIDSVFNYHVGFRVVESTRL